MKQTIYEHNWEIAREDAEADGLRIIEYGWEQHVIIDETAGIVYRYPRHAAAAAKLTDEVSVLHAIHQQSWPIELPVMRVHNDIFTSYNLIVGDVLDAGLLAELTDSQLNAISTALGAFMVPLHHFDATVIEHKETKQTTSLLEYYAARINGAPDTAFFHQAHQALQTLSASSGRAKQVVVHGDLHGLNIVINESKELQGVIDLSEMETGDPHQDFRKLFMTDPRLLEPALAAYHSCGGPQLNSETVKLWAYVNEWANLCHFAGSPSNQTYQRALKHLQKWRQF